MLLVVLVGLLVTAVASWTAQRLDRSNERGLLRVQTRQAGNVIGAAVVGIVNPLRSALQVADETGGSPDALRRVLAPSTGPRATFVGVTVWRVDGTALTPVAAVGASQIVDPASDRGRAIAARARRSRTFTVEGIFAATPQRVCYAVGDRLYVVYGERAIPMNRQVPAERDSAFADLHFATYLGTRVDPRTLSTTNVDPSRLPLRGVTAQTSIPFGDRQILLVATPATHLGGALAARLPWIAPLIGLLLTALAALAVRQLVGRRLAAESDAATIKNLYEELDGLYSEQRSVSLTLQHALLPRNEPSVEGVEFASAYVAGDRGVEIGGDWYSVIAMPGGRFAFVVGDVSGRGVDAAAIMARVRFTLRAYLLEGHDAATALGMAARDLDVVRDGHLVTVLVAVGEPATRTLTVASAGHLPPLLVSDESSEFGEIAVAPPLGVGVQHYPATTLRMAPGSLLVAFTDGLVERRGEDIDRGLERLAAAVTLPDGPLEAWLAELLPAQLGDEANSDDVAVLALRWGGDEPDGATDAPAAAEPTVQD